MPFNNSFKKNAQTYPYFDKLPKKQGLYNPLEEHDACGVGFVANIDGDKNHDIILNGIQVLENMKHRGAEGADSKSGDGAGIMTQIPHEFILLHGIPVPERGKYGTGLVFLPKDELVRNKCVEIIRRNIEEVGLKLMYIRDVPTDNSEIGEYAKEVEPICIQIFVTGDVGDSLELKLYLVRKQIENEVIETFDDPKACYIVSLSSKRIIYKGMLSSIQLKDYFTDLSDPYYTSAIALVHSRFSTNTFPTWSMAQPFRMLGHNGEINTITGNRIWMKAACTLIAKKQFPDYDFKKILPIIQPEMSDSASLDNILEFFVMAGMSLPRALAMLIPESFNEKNPISADLKGFYDYHSIFMNPWDGPAAIMFSDGRYIGGMLDRNGLRPARYMITKDGMIVAASETGVLEIEPENIKEKGRFKPGKIMIIDTKKGKVFYDDEIKSNLAKQYPYSKWLAKNRVQLDDVTSGRKVSYSVNNLDKKLKVFNYSTEEIEKIIIPMLNTAKEPMGSMGNDTPQAFLSEKPQLIFNYFRQRFAQVTNPPIDPIREDLMMSLSGHIGTASNALIIPKEEHCKVVKLHNSLITNRELDILDHLDYKGFKTTRLSTVFKASLGVKGLEDKLELLCRQAEQDVDKGCNYIIISDRAVDENNAPIPSLLALSAIHNSLVSKNKRAQTAIIVETAEAREVMHIAELIGFGASAVCPYLAFALIENIVKSGKVQLDYPTAERHYINAVDKGLKKIISKLGISTIRSFRGAQLFTCLGLSEDLTKKYFPDCETILGCISLKQVTDDVLSLFKMGMESPKDEVNTKLGIPHMGSYMYSKGGESHAWTPIMVRTLKEAVRKGDYDEFLKFSKMSDEKSSPLFIRDLLNINSNNSIDISEVESEESICKRFVAGAMSFGAISIEAHKLLARVMNKIGGKSNTGEGGEDPTRYILKKGKISERSAIKQIASGRFGVDTEYLVNADEIQIKVAQGAKPGEGGQLPGFKVDDMVAKTRHSIPGITLISPPPHHDIYSIEDLAQLIFDIRNVNPNAVVSVKLVAGQGIGTIAAGVIKAKSDKIVISGADGGTGASPLSSMKYAGLPMEIGLAEVQQTLMLNHLRDKVLLQVDGELKTAHDIIIAALLGADEYAFGTSLLIAMGCVMDRKCHTNKCLAGIATQDPVCRKKFMAKDADVENYLIFLARNVREILASIGVKSLDDIIGHTALLQLKDKLPKKIKDISVDSLLYCPEPTGSRKFCGKYEDNSLLKTKDNEFIKMAKLSINEGIPIEINSTICNTERSVGTMLSGIIAKKYGSKGLKDNTISITLKGSAGQSFGAFLAHGISLYLEGDANDYLGKGLSGGKIVVYPSSNVCFDAQNNVIAGNTILYGATQGEVYISGCVGERFCVRNSGALAVVEGVGDHGCEYMTGGRVVILGQVGRNFAAGMSGGIAYVWNENNDFDYYCNMSMIEITLLTAQDKKELRNYIIKHFHNTKSIIAKKMLDDWDNYSSQFLKVLPIEYKKILDSEKIV